MLFYTRPFYSAHVMYHHDDKFQTTLPDYFSFTKLSGIFMYIVHVHVSVFRD